MTGFQILFGRTEQARAGRLQQGVLDLIVDGMNLTARVGENHVAPFLRDLTYAAADLATGRRGRATLPFYLQDDPWELGIVREGTGVLVSLFRGGASAEVAIHERLLPGDALLAGLARALDERLARRAHDHEHADLACARALLESQGAWCPALPSTPAWITLPEDENAPLAFSCELLLRPPSPDEPPPSVARTDLLSLLAASRLRFRAGNAERDLGECFAFLVAERLVDLAHQALQSLERAQPLHRRFEAGRLSGALQLDARGALQLTLRRASASPGSSAGDTFPGLDPRAFGQAVADLGRALGRALLRHDRSQAFNLRLDSFRNAVRRLQAALRPRQEPPARVNNAPDSYRAYALAAHKKPAAEGPGLGQGKLRFAPRWQAEVAGLDLANTFLCGDRLLITSHGELCALGRNTGDRLWVQPVQRAIAIPTPGGLARLHPDGQLHVHDYGNGEISLAVQLGPRVGGSASGMVIHAPGLPKLLVVTEGERHLSAVDLVSGEIRWRHTLPRGSAARLRRAGKLLVFSAGDQHLTALDVQSGEIVWRFRTEAPCQQAASFDHDVLFQITNEGSGRRGAQLHAVDAWTGAVRFSVALPPRPEFQGAPLVTRDTVALLTRDERGTGLIAFDRGTGEKRYQIACGEAPRQASWLAVDDCLFANTERGALLAIDAASGETRFRLQLCKEMAEDDVPRRLDPVLRSGALFVPQQEVYVVRPRDGELLGQVPCEIVPDLLRVDERCDVYVGEESGRLAAFGTAPRLTLVKS
jgi:outer membrane protein assembly factor BamB